MSKTKKYVVRQIRLVDRFLDGVIQGKKRSTIRHGSVFVTDTRIPLVSNRRRVTVRIVTVEYGKNYGDLDERDARRDGFESLDELKTKLERFYPGISPDDPVTIISFVMDSEGDQEHVD